MDYLFIHYFSKTGKYLNTVRYTGTWGFPQLFINDDEYLSVKTRNEFEVQWVNLAKGSFKSILDEFIFVYVIYFGEYWSEQQIDIFSLEGKYLYRTVLKPGNEEEIYSSGFPSGKQVVIKDGFLYTSLMDEGGDLKVVKYQVSLPKN